MAVLNGKKTRQNLLNKGFVEIQSHHHMLEFWHDGVCVTKTHTSHNGEDIHDGLISSMGKQTRMGSQFFKAFAKCDKSKDDYIKLLEDLKIIRK
jgi:predicted RNA binding protein YcfA (HicA-like mRNA interferase family)